MHAIDLTVALLQVSESEAQPTPLRPHRSPATDKPAAVEAEQQRTDFPATLASSAAARTRRGASMRLRIRVLSLRAAHC